MRCCIIIPARYKSTRFPGKPLVPLLGKPMILWVAELSAKAVGKSNVYIATEDDRIDQEVKKYSYMWREGGQFSTEKYLSENKN